MSKKILIKVKNVVTYPARKVVGKIVDKIWKTFNLLSH